LQELNNLWMMKISRNYCRELNSIKLSRN